MKKYTFQCGGDHGAWECLVDVQLTDDQETRLLEFAKKNEFLDWSNEVLDIYSMVLSKLAEQSDDDFDADSVLIWIPFGLRKNLL